MGQLKEGATLIYERVGETIYARESGTTERTVVGYTIPQDALQKITSYEVWKDIMREANCNPTLRDALSRVQVIYELSKREYE